MKLLLFIIGVCVCMVMGEPINVAVPAAVPQVTTPAFSSEAVIDSAAPAKHDIMEPTELPVHLLPLKLDLGDTTKDIEALGISLDPAEVADIDMNTPSHEGDGLVEIDGDVNLEINILAGLEADAAQTASGELTSFAGASEEEIKGIVEGVVDEQDLDAFAGISDAEIEADGESLEADATLNGKEEDDKDKAEHEKQEKKEEEEKEKEKKSEGEVEEKKEAEKDVSGTEIEFENTGIEVKNPVNHGEVTVNYLENLNLNLGGRHGKSFRGLHHLARKLRLMKRIVKWFQKPIHHRLALLRFAKYHKIRVLELKLRLAKLKLLTDAIKMLRLARVVTMLKLKGDLTKLAIGHAIYRKYRQPHEDVKIDEDKSTVANRLAKIRAFKNLLRARRLARFRTSPIRREFRSRVFPTSPIVSSSAWRRRQFVTSPIVSHRQWSSPSSQSFIVQPNPYHLLPLRGVDASEVLPSGTEIGNGFMGVQVEPHEVEYDGDVDSFEDTSNMDNEGLYEDAFQLQHSQPITLQHFPTAPIFETSPIVQHPYNIMFSGEGHHEPEQDDDVDTDGYETIPME